VIAERALKSWPEFTTKLTRPRRIEGGGLRLPAMLGDHETENFQRSTLNVQLQASLIVEG
jgi:hypothetical protein